MKGLFRCIYAIYAAIVFLVLMLMVFPLVVVASFWGRIKGGNMIYRICICWADIWFALTFIRLKKIYEAPYDPGQKHIIVANHISYLDIPVLVKAFRQPLRPLGKAEMSKVPVFGFIYTNAIVTVDRSNAQNRAASMRIMRSILNKGISVFVFPEGTFNETGRPLHAFYDGAFRLAVETQTHIKPVLFLDTYDRLHYRSVFSMNPGKCRVVYLEDVIVDETTKADALKDKVYQLMNEKLLTYNASWINSNK